MADIARSPGIVSYIPEWNLGGASFWPTERAIPRHTTHSKKHHPRNFLHHADPVERGHAPRACIHLGLQSSLSLHRNRSRPTSGPSSVALQLASSDIGNSHRLGVGLLFLCDLSLENRLLGLNRRISVQPIPALRARNPSKYYAVSGIISIFQKRNATRVAAHRESDLVASIKLRHVGVLFPIYDANTRSLKKRLLGGSTGGTVQAGQDRHRPTVVRALSNLTMDLEHGERIGLVGHNGAGKTTLLRVLAGVYEPSEGDVVVQGHTAPLFDISLGMDPEGTGYENIVLRGLFLGMTHKQIDERVDEIAQFTELGDFLDLPIRTYSSGMRMRLSFAVATSIQPDILLLDEGIGAGDASFMAKASKRLNDFTAKASIIVLASHSDSLIKRMCKKAALLEHGELKAVGPVKEVLEQYHARKTKR